MTTTIEGCSFRRKASALLLAACWLAGPGAQAAPTLPQVVAGQASFNQQGKVFSITNTPGTIINWQSFNIGAGETTRFIQQSSDSAVLNRILGQDPTRILGALQSNGKVFLINPNGILFGQGARVDVNGLVASTLNLSDADFLAGKKNFQAGAGAAPGAVRNGGAIATPDGGKVFLIAPEVENTGIIKAPNGEVVLAAGRSVQLVDSADPNLQVVVAAPNDQALNLGRIIAQGGRIGIYGALVNQRGLVNADSAVVGANGRIVLKASGSTTLGAGSATHAVGAGQGGEIQVLGRQVAIEGQASVDASGRLGGGTVLVGGDYQGGAGAAGSVQRAQSARLDAGASIRADATVDGSGGKVVLWSDGETRAAGSISARGIGAGNGGLVETSGHLLDVDGVTVNAAGGKLGKNGTWLLDPYDIEVVAGGTASAKDVRTAGSGAPDGVTRIAPSTLTSAGADVILQAQHDLTISNTIEAAGSVRAQAGNDITVNARVASRDGDLDFRAGNAFTLGAGGSLGTGNYIDIAANKVTLSGGIDKGTGTQLPILSFTSSDPGRAIVVGSGTPDANALWLDAATLGRLSSSLFEINLGNSKHTGPVSIDANLTASSSLVMENAGNISVQGQVDLTSNPDSRVFATLYLPDSGADSRIRVTGGLSASRTITLDAGSGAVEISAGARVSSASGLVSIVAASTQVASGTISEGGQQQPTPPVTPPVKPPALETCLATPAAAGCADVIAKAVQACTIDPNGANCGKVLPKLETCQADPSAPGCGVVLSHHEIDICLADPKQPGCDAKIPAYDACQAAPSSYGCGPVIQRHDAITACIVNPGAPGCAQTLPTLTECRINAGIYGCVPVLARGQFESCVAHPEGAGCLDVLPKLPVCKLTPGAEGCAQVLELAFQACLAKPNDASCSGVLPTLSQCVNQSSGRGCEVVLPTLSQCIGSPSLQGCSVRLPSLQTCAASPSTQGCEAVLPKPDFCGTHPADPTCAIFGGGATEVQGKPVAQVVQGTVQLINRGTAEVAPPTGKPAGDENDKKPGQAGKDKGPAQADNTGAKNEKPATKMYCN